MRPENPEELINQFRTVFAKLSREHQVREVNRCARILKGRRPILVEPLDDPSRIFKFNSPAELVKWLKSLGADVISNSNIYKCLRGERQNAYGYRIYYGEEN